MATTTSRNVEKMGETAQRMTQSTQRAGKIVSGYLTEAQEINTDFARRAAETWIDAFRKQTDLNQRMVQRLYGEAEGQTGAFQSFRRDWMSAYSMPFSNPFGSVNLFDFFRQGGQTATRNAERVTEMTQRTTVASVASVKGGFPIAGYDELNANEVADKLDGLTEEQLKTVREYELRNKNRDTLIEQIDRRIKAATA